MEYKKKIKCELYNDSLKEQDVKSAYPDEDYLYDLEVAKAESRIYKELYENLLREVVGK